MTSPRVAVLVLLWNGLEDAVACLRSLARSGYPNQVTIVVDNGSREGVVRALRRSFPSVVILEAGANLGFSAGNNLGLRRALGLGCDYVLLLNQDTAAEPDMVGKLVRFAESHPAAGIIGPAVYYPGRAKRIYSLGGSISWPMGTTEHIGMPSPGGEPSGAALSRPVDFVPGCGMLVTRRFLETVGLLDPDFFFNYEDVDWAVRGWRLGFEAWCVPEAVLRHRVSASLGVSSPANTYYMTRNGLRFFWRHADASVRWLAVARILMRTCRSIAAWCLKPAYRGEVYRRRTLANLAAIRDFARGRYGRMGAGVSRICKVSD